jgi:hypothetical protein
VALAAAFTSRGSPPARRGTRLAPTAAQEEPCMRNKPWAQMVVVVMALFALTVGCRSMSTATPDELDPAAIEASIRSQILAEYPDETFDLGISVANDGTVTLSGDVDSDAQKTRIGELARSVAGVDRVVNNLTVE